MFEFSVNKSDIELVTKESVISGSKNVYQAKFTFSEDWNMMTRTAVFRAGVHVINVPLDDTNVCTIPWEVLSVPNVQLQVGVYGTKGNDVIVPTVYENCGTILEGVTLGDDGSTPEESVYNQILINSQEAISTAKKALETAESVRIDADNGVFNGPQGEKGDPGGIPKGGLIDQVLVKESGEDYEANWADRAHPFTETAGPDEKVIVDMAAKGSYLHPISEIKFVQEPGELSLDTPRNISGWSQIKLTRNGDESTRELAQTVYGGTYNWASGVLTITHKYFELSVMDMNNNENYPGWKIDDLSECVEKGIDSPLKALFIDNTMSCNITDQFNTTTKNIIGAIYVTTPAFGMNQTQWKETYPKLKVQFVLPLLTPYDIHLTPQEFLAISDHEEFSSDCGSTSVEYNVDTKKYVENEISKQLGHNPETCVGLRVDYTTGEFTRLAGAVGKNAGKDFDIYPMYGDRKRCIVMNDGTITAWRGNGEDDWYDNDGNPTEVDEENPEGQEGQVMVYQPAFWYKVVPLVLDKIAAPGFGFHIRKAEYYISSIPKPGFKLHPAFYDENGNPVEYILFSAYEGSMWDASTSDYVNDNIHTDIAYEKGDMLCSIANQKPISGLRTGMGSRDSLEAMAKNRGNGWHIDTIKSISANQLLMMIEFGTMNSQASIDIGVTAIVDDGTHNCSSLTGSTIKLGNLSGSAKETINEIGGKRTTETEHGKVSISYRGVENLWNNIMKHINGINIWCNSTRQTCQAYIANDFNFNDRKNDDNYRAVGFMLPSKNGYISAMGYGNEEYDWLFLASETDGTYTSPVGDGCTAPICDPYIDSYKIATFGGGWSSTYYAGIFYINYNSGIPGRYRDISGRLLYVPTANR